MKVHFVCIESCFEILFQRLMPALKVDYFNNTKCVLYIVYFIKSLYYVSVTSDIKPKTRALRI